jgi:hypothetical protein
MHIKPYILILLFCFIGLSSSAQVDEQIREAYGFYVDGNHKEAARIMDEVVTTKKGSVNKEAWHFRGFIYKDIFLEKEDGAEAYEAREIAIESLKKSIQFDEAESLAENNTKALRVLGVSYFNDASEVIDERDPKTIDKADVLYYNYREVMKYLYPNTSLKDKDIEFYLAMSTAHRKIYEKDREANIKNWEISSDYLMRVLELDPDNWAANYSQAVQHYNKGAYDLQKLENVESIPDIYQIQSESIRSIEIALPYMYKAYEIDPDQIEAIKGLKWIYFNLHKYNESEEMEKLENRLQGNGGK